MLPVTMDSTKRESGMRDGAWDRRGVMGLLAAAGAALSAPGARARRAVQSVHMLWYRQPAQEWTEALPIGNGRIGAMVFGGIAEERLQLNEDTLWAGGPYDPVNPAAK